MTIQDSSFIGVSVSKMIKTQIFDLFNIKIEKRGSYWLATTVYVTVNGSALFVCTASTFPAKFHVPDDVCGSTIVSANLVSPSGVHIGWPLSSPSANGPVRTTS
jgi:hypothetical protein